jgi:EAL domain-containing protein (putative c-di-GMP-specific phosphodiesterase class I)
MRLLRECGIDYAQGPHVGRARPVAEIWPAA